MNTNIISNLSDFHKMVESYHSSHAIYRGVSKDSYKLITSFGRFQIKNEIRRSAPENNTTYTINKFTEIGSLEQFKKRSYKYHKKVPNNDWEWLTIAQHFGMPTRYLDWTMNPLVAAFFACSGSSFDSNAAIYIIPDEYSLPSIEKIPTPFDISKVTRYDPIHSYNRITAQSGLFTTHPSPNSEFDDPKIDKWIIDKEFIIDLRIMLNIYGVSKASMFPGLEGITKQICYDFGLT